MLVYWYVDKNFDDLFRTPRQWMWAMVPSSLLLQTIQSTIPSLITLSMNCRARILFLESIAGVPGMVAAMCKSQKSLFPSLYDFVWTFCFVSVRHFKSLRMSGRDGGWIRTLLEEAENERVHQLFRFFFSFRSDWCGSSDEVGSVDASLDVHEDQATWHYFPRNGPSCPRVSGIHAHADYHL